MTLEEIKVRCNELSVSERAELANFLWDTLDDDEAEDPEGVAAAWREEIDRRMNDLKTGKAVGIPAEQVFSELRARYEAVVLHPQARAEFDRAADYYESEREGLGIEFQEEVEAAFLRICKHPQAYHPVGNGVRRHLVTRFPYSIFYAELDELIWIAAIAHQKRKPGYWKRRKKPT